MTCPNCHSPERSLWALFGASQKPAFTTIKNGNWISLVRCLNCQALWCTSPYEPYAAWEFAAAWPLDEAGWHKLHAIDNGATITRWLSLAIRDHWQALPEPERAAVEQWRARSHGWNPIDNAAEFRPAPLPLTAPERAARTLGERQRGILSRLRRKINGMRIRRSIQRNRQP